MSNDNTLMTAALDYVAKGFSIFPLKPGSKVPLTARGYKDASNDPEQVRQWWTQWPDANISLPTGKINGFFVVDIDGAYPEGWPPLPDTTVVKTRRGFHHYYHYPEGQDVPSANKLLKQAVDIKSDGGYIVAPPSIHSEGGRYEFIV